VGNPTSKRSEALPATAKPKPGRQGQLRIPADVMHKLMKTRDCKLLYLDMKNTILILSLILTINSYSQVPDHFKVLQYNDIDSSLSLLKKIARQQYKPVPFFIDITMEYIAQDRTERKLDPLTMDIRFEISTSAIYYENITSVIVKDLTVWKIYFKSKITGQSDLFILKDKEMAEKAYAALICLIKNSGNTRF
jgi:hypothetical protein